MLCGTSQLAAVANMSLVLLSVLWFIVQTKAIAIRQIPEFEGYEVVHPKKLHILHKREIQNNQTETHDKEEKYEPELQYQIMLNGEVILYLQKTKHLLGPDYAETYYSPRGEEITTSPQTMEHCYYTGHILNDKNSVASISTCNGLRGFFTHRDQRYMIEPLKNTDQEEHAVLTYNQEEPDPANHTCGVKNVGRRYGRIRTSRSLSSSEIYNTIDIQVALVGMEIWSDGDKIKVEPNTGVTFNNFLNWHRSNLGKMKTHDHAQLLSGIAFNNRRVGMANANSLCSPTSVAVIEVCKPTVNSKFPKDFSTLSRSHFEKYILSQKPKCLLEAPIPKNIITKPVCGNKLLEVGEACDCGSPKECADPSCEAMTCTLKPAADADGGEETLV
ncbi:ADAM-like, decysin 1 [Myotis davidii]|uniref:ADAM-like, decysin 1 n=1 Tax=Myotis davidii TaxID=225400 RepID=L5LDJ1_MYODS|nr:ADAM-like, decysin 1 [Myotis davidii]